MLNRLLLIVGALIVLTLVTPTHMPLAAQDDIPDNCENTAGEFYQPNIFVRYDRNNARLVLVDWTTGDITRVLEADLRDDIRIIRWSPNCRYLAVSRGVSRFADEPIDTGAIDYVSWGGCCRWAIRFYDVVDGFLIGEAPGTLDVIWSPNSDQVITIDRYRDYALYTLANNHINDLGYVASSPGNGEPRGLFPSLEQIFWDYARGWIWMSAHGGIIVYSLSGDVIRIFENYNHLLAQVTLETTTSYAFSQDETKIVLYGQHDALLRMAPALAVYDIASGQGVRLNPERNAAGIVALSADNRYLVMGYTALRVWDLQNVAPNFEDRLPVLRLAGTDERITTLRFIDTTVVEMATVSGAVIRYDVQTGARVDT